MADGPGKAFSVPSYVSVGDPYPASLAVGETVILMALPLRPY